LESNLARQATQLESTREAQTRAAEEAAMLRACLDEARVGGTGAAAAGAGGADTRAAAKLLLQYIERGHSGDTLSLLAATLGMGEEERARLGAAAERLARTSSAGGAAYDDQRRGPRRGLLRTVVGAPLALVRTLAGGAGAPGGPRPAQSAPVKEGSLAEQWARFLLEDTATSGAAASAAKLQAAVPGAGIGAGLGAAPRLAPDERSLLGGAGGGSGGGVGGSGGGAGSAAAAAAIPALAPSYGGASILQPQEQPWSATAGLVSTGAYSYAPAPAPAAGGFDAGAYLAASSLGASGLGVSGLGAAGLGAPDLGAPAGLGAYGAAGLGASNLGAPAGLGSYGLPASALGGDAGFGALANSSALAGLGGGLGGSAGPAGGAASGLGGSGGGAPAPGGDLSSLLAGASAADRFSSLLAPVGGAGATDYASLAALPTFSSSLGSDPYGGAPK
jgi:hypothetical protein